LLKDIITIFYAPLAQVYRAASISDSLSDLQTFISDLIKTVEKAEAGKSIFFSSFFKFVYSLYLMITLSAGTQDPSATVKMFVDLVQRHEQSFYDFVHKVHTKGAGLFDSLLRWMELFINFVREGLGEPISLEFLLPHAGSERIEIMKEVDAVALYHYRLKVAHESKVRKRFNRGEGVPSADGNNTTADEDDEATQALIDEAVRDFSFGDLVNGDLEELNDEDDDDESSDEDSEEFESTEEMDETDTTETEAETDSTEEESQIPRPLDPQSPATRRVPPSAPLPQAYSRHQHSNSHPHPHPHHLQSQARASRSVTSLNSTTPTQKTKSSDLIKTVEKAEAGNQSFFLLFSNSCIVYTS